MRAGAHDTQGCGSIRLHFRQLAGQQCPEHSQSGQHEYHSERAPRGRYEANHTGSEQSHTDHRITDGDIVRAPIAPSEVNNVGVTAKSNTTMGNR